MVLRIHRSILGLMAILSVLFACVYSTQVKAQGSASSSKLGSIKGRVLADGHAVTNARVTVSSVNSPRHSRVVPTNDDGDFEVKGLEPGLYNVEVFAPAHVYLPGETDSGVHRVGDSITVNMIKGGVIAGRVLAANNDPVVAVRVRASMIRDVNSRRPMIVVPDNERLTDDRGNFRIFGLAPGTYVVFAGGRGFSGTGANAYDNDAPTFAPSSTRDTAEEITIASGEERTIEIRYGATTGHAVSGNVNAQTTPNSPWIMIHLDRVVKSRTDFRMSTYQRAGAKGFEFKGVADGDYLVWAAYGSRSIETLVSEPKRITVKGADISGIELVVKPLASVAGAVVLEPSTIEECKNKRRPLFNETLVSLEHPQRAEPAKTQEIETPFYGSSQASPDAAGSFRLRNLAAGQYNFNIRHFARHWYLRSVTVPVAKESTTTDLARTLLNVRSGEYVTGIKATLTEGAASISGRVEVSEDRRPPGRIVFYVVPAENEKRDEPLRYFAAPVAEDDSFTIDHVPPGRYWMIAKLVTAENETNTAALRLPAAAAARVKLRREAEAANSEIELKPCQSVKAYKLPLAPK